MQSYQIAAAKTTNEMANFHRYSYLSRRGGAKVREHIVAALSAGPGAASAAQVGEDESGFGDHARVNNNELGDNSLTGRGRAVQRLQEQSLSDTSAYEDRFNSGCLKLFVGRSRKRRYRVPENNNPFDFSCWNNCADFWTQGNGGMLQNVDWYGLYDVPLIERTVTRRNGGYVAVAATDDNV